MNVKYKVSRIVAVLYMDWWVFVRNVGHFWL